MNIVQNKINNSITGINQITNSSFFFLDGYFNKNENSRSYYEQQVKLYQEKKNEIEDSKNEVKQKSNFFHSINGTNNIYG